MSLRTSTQPFLARALRQPALRQAVSSRNLATSTSSNGVLLPSSSSSSSFSSLAGAAKQAAAVDAIKSSMRAFSASARSQYAEVQTVGESPFGINSLSKFSEEEEMLRETVRRYAEDVVQPKVMEMDETETMDPQIIKDLFSQGLMGIETSPEHGGAGCSFTAAIIVIEELAKVDPSVSVLCDVHNTLVNTVLRKYASKELQDKYLPQLSTELLGSFCLSEPASGSDAFAMKTSYKKSSDGKHFVINGSKMWITNGADAGFFLIFAQGDPSKGYKGISCFAVEKDWGVQVAKKEKKLGIKASSTVTLNFDDLQVPVENLVGEEGKGYKIAIEILNEGRVGIGAQMLGLAEGAFVRGVRYAQERKQFGQPVAAFQGMQFQFAQIATEIEATRALVYNAARLKEEGRPFLREAAMAKLYSSQVAERASGAAIEWCGGQGFTREQGIEKYWRDSKIGAIYEGTSSIQKLTIWKQTEARLKNSA